MKIEKLLEIVGRFDKLPDDAVVPTEVTAAVLGLCAKSVRDNPELPKRWVSPKRYGQSVRDIRRLVRSASRNTVAITSSSGVSHSPPSK
jgi:hypothetical protein